MLVNPSDYGFKKERHAVDDSALCSPHRLRCLSYRPT